MKWVKRCAKKITTYIKLSRSSFQKLILFYFSNLEGAGDGDGSPDPDVLLIGAFGDILFAFESLYRGRLLDLWW